MKRLAPYLAELVLLSGIYLVTARGGLMLGAASGFATLVWIPSGLALSALLLRGYDRFPAITLGAFIVNLWVGASPGVAAGIATGNTLEALFGAIALRRLTGFRESLERVRDVVALALVAAAASTLVSATVGVISLLLGGRLHPPNIAGTWSAWWWGDLTGILIVAPALLTWQSTAAGPPRDERRRIAEMAALALCLALIGGHVFFGWFVPFANAPRRPHLLYPLLIWAAVRFGPSGAARINLVTCIMAVSATVAGYGPFVLGTLLENLLGLQSFMAVSGFATLVLGAISAEREHARADLELRVEQRTAALRRINQDLARREEQLREAQALAHLGSFEWDLASNRVIASDELYRIFGNEPKTSIPYDSLIAQLHPEDRAHVRGTLERALAHEVPFELECRIIRTDGAVRMLQSHVERELDASGRMTKLVGVCQDVTEDRAAQEALRKAEAKFRGFVEAAPDGMVIVDRDGNIVLANSQTERLFGRDRSTLLGTPIETLIPERFRGRHVPHRAHYLEVPKVRPMGSGLELFGLRADGTEFPVEISLAPVDTKEGLLISGTIRDITERKAIESRLKDSLRDKEILLREIHHRVKNNLQVIGSLLHLQAASVASEEARIGLEESQRRIQSMALVHELLYQSRDFADIELSEYLTILVAKLGQSYGVATRGIDLDVSSPRIRLDLDTAIPCGLIVNELVSNSLKHAYPDGRRGRVCVTLERYDATRFALVVRDDGIGISPEFRLDAIRTLGLQIVRTLAKQLRGTFEIRNEAGTVSRIVLALPTDGQTAFAERPTALG
ncbi:MAG: PAS domain S-box protein [Polyangiaceae bacterium]|nr:PAS domain S-box protein [Polyangiaceae bacterium]